MAPAVRGRALALTAPRSRKSNRRLGSTPSVHLRKFVGTATSVPAIKNAIALFATDLFVSYRFKLTTVKQYLSRAGRDVVGPKQLGVLWTPKSNDFLKTVIDEVLKTELAWIRRAAPIDRAFLRDAVAFVSGGRGGRHRREHLRCLITQWFFLARVSEVVATGKAAGGTALLRKDVVALDYAGATYRLSVREFGADAAAFRFAGSKTDRAMAGQRRIVGSTGDPALCAVRCIEAQLAHPGQPSDPLFPHTSTLSLSAFVKAVAAYSGRDPSGYSTHSARRGGATAYYQACGSETMLKYFGRWAKDSTEHLTYMQPSLESMVTAGSQMIDSQATSMGW